jgi:hypothetical protein
MTFNYTPPPATPLIKAQRELTELRQRHHQEWLEMFHKLSALKKELARNCEHDWDNANHWCKKCGLDTDYYRQKGLWK